MTDRPVVIAEVFRDGEPAYTIAASEPLSMDCPMCAPFDCDDPDRHLGVPSEYTPLRNRGCRCGADFDGRDCMCFEGTY
jgi:hypothetical protein